MVSIVLAGGGARRELESRGRAFESGLHFGEFFGLAGERPELTLGLVAFGARARGVNLLWKLREVCEDGDAVVVDLDEAARHHEAARLRALRVGEHARPEFGDERRVSGQDAEFAARARHGHAVNLLR